MTMPDCDYYCICLICVNYFKTNCNCKWIEFKLPTLAVAAGEPAAEGVIIPTGVLAPDYACCY